MYCMSLLWFVIGFFALKLNQKPISLEWFMWSLRCSTLIPLESRYRLEKHLYYFDISESWPASTHAIIIMDQNINFILYMLTNSIYTNPGVYFIPLNPCRSCRMVAKDLDLEKAPTGKGKTPKNGKRSKGSKTPKAKGNRSKQSKGEASKKPKKNRSKKDSTPADSADPDSAAKSSSKRRKASKA